jgi:DNA modification methylase
MEGNQVNTATILVGDVRKQLATIPDGTVQCCVTSPPYWGLRDYGHDGQLGLETTPEQYVENMVKVFREVRRVLADDGVLWLNLGDSYAGGGRGGQSAEKRSANWQPEYALKGHVPEGIKPKDLVGIPWRVAFALQTDGWWLRQDIIWHKPNPMPESVTDRCTKAHEYVFMLTKSARYYFNHNTIKEEAKTPPTSRDKHGEGYQADYPNGDRFSAGERIWGADGKRNRRSVWTIPTKPFKGAHFAVMPEALCEPPILATSQPNDLVLDPFTGSGTVAVVALRNNRNFIGCELNHEYATIAQKRIEQDQPILNQVLIQ